MCPTLNARPATKMYESLMYESLMYVCLYVHLHSVSFIVCMYFGCVGPQLSHTVGFLQATPPCTANSGTFATDGLP